MMRWGVADVAKEDSAFRLISVVLWAIVAFPFMLMGCVFGWLCAAFLAGYKQGSGDYKKYLAP